MAGRKTIGQLQVELRADTVRKVAERDGWTCFYCERELLLHVPRKDERYATLDHVNPRSLGGEDGSDNYVLACNRCNVAKANDWLFFVDIIRTQRAELTQLRKDTTQVQRKIDNLERFRNDHEKCETSRIIRDQVALIKQQRSDLVAYARHHDAEDDTSL
ncbi:hypothetical protein GTQ99_00500 [Kineococcus sp. T13]|uniref:HNH endonuclease n=1 Tax=Kineococcus vitellinus TaxID=2696565 RepID=UPI0014129F7F|nr:HNH endonuclease [Kineococcus vitellinus]NAZ73911.1 hypothetical protein [Kineococcus vitellinus]